MKLNIKPPLSQDAIQTVLTGIVGDGTVYKKPKAGDYYFTTSCVHKEYVEYKQQLIGNTASSVSVKMNHGYKLNKIYNITTQQHPDITAIATNSLESNIKLLTELGVALWFYDDGSLHKDNHFYNLCTHAFSLEEHMDIIIPFLSDFLDADVRLRTERKKDGRLFYYCSINKMKGAFNVSALLCKYPVICYWYKIIENTKLRTKVALI